MSLMHDALKVLDKSVTGTAAGGFVMGAEAPAASGKLRSFLAGMLPLLLLGAVGAWWIKQHDATVTPPPPQIGLPLAPTAPAVQEVQPAPMVSAPASAAVMPVTAALKATSLPATKARVAGKPASEKSHQAIVHADRIRAREFRATPQSQQALQAQDAAPPAAQNQPSAGAIFPRFLQALEHGDTAAGREQLDKLAAILPADSLTLLRAQAWYAVKTGDAASARKFYAALLERKTGDEEASINLAAIESGAGHTDNALAILADAMQANPDSAALQQGMRKLRGGR